MWAPSCLVFGIYGRSSFSLVAAWERQAASVMRSQAPAVDLGEPLGPPSGPARLATVTSLPTPVMHAEHTRSLARMADLGC
jgi:hypothetical protein